MLALLSCWVRARLMTDSPLTLVTGASSSHFKSLLQLLCSIAEHEPDMPVVAYDLGLHPYERAEVAALFPQYRLPRFDFRRYPAHVDLGRERGQYAWKPIIVWQVLARVAGPVCWMDAGNVLTARLNGIRSALAVRGFYSPVSKGTINDWTHPGMLDYFGVDAQWAAGRRNLSGACIAFHPRNLRALKLAKAWRDGALIKRCIAPRGSSRANHRQDQALLTVLAHRSGFPDAILREKPGFVIHQDIDNGWRERLLALQQQYAQRTMPKPGAASRTGDPARPGRGDCQASTGGAARDEPPGSSSLSHRS